ncbi:MAG: cyclic nucleotide-binding domain-containing protein [Desulfomonilaceae bacterium]
MMKIPYPRELDPDALERLPENVRLMVKEKGLLRDYNPGDILMAPGDCGDRIRVLMSGDASVVLRDGDDQDVAVEVLRPGDLFGEISFLTGHPSPANTEIVANEPCRILEVPSRDFEQIVHAHPDVTVALIRNLARKIMRLDRSVLANKAKRRALQSLISREEHIFPDYVIGDYVRRHLSGKLEEFAHSDGPVLIIGETGVGKEVLAHALFRLSPQYKSVFLLLDLLRTRQDQALGGGDTDGGGSDTNLTREQIRLFFGSEEKIDGNGSKTTPGYIELTEDGTLLVRGVEHLTAEMQRELLQAVTGGNFRRYNGSTQQQAQIRLIATTALPVAEISQDRHPLLHGLKDRSLVIPPLRTRRREIPGLVQHYLSQYCQELRKEIAKLPKETLKALVNYSWPGNDVELSTTLKRAVLVSEGGVLRPQDIYFDLKRVEGEGRFNLLRLQAVRQAVRSPLFPAIFQSAVTPFFFILLVLLFLGPADPMKNPAALFSWAVGWPTLILGAFVWARFWCSLCPIGTLSKLAKKVFALERPFPQFLKSRSDLVIVAAVLVIIWFETATDIRSSPFNVGLLLLTMLVSAVIVGVIFERQSWCRYLCGLGGMIGILAKTSPLELRADRNVCISQCVSNECYLGTPTGEGCPFGQVAPKLHSNRYCKLCGQCVKNCPHGAINLNLRIPGKEIWEMRHTNTRTAFLIIGMASGLLSDMLSKMPIYHKVTGFLPLPEIAKFTIFFLALILGFNLMLLLATALSHKIYHDSFTENYSRYGLALLPLVLTGFSAYHLYYLINLGVHLPMLVSQTFQFEIFRHLIITVPPWLTHFFQELLIWIGLVWSLMIMYRLGSADREGFWGSLFGMLPHGLLAVAIAWCLLETTTVFFYHI